MRLTFEQIKSITLGAARICEEERGIRFFRFTKVQEDYYRPFKDFYFKTFAGSGIVLEFVTDSPYITIELETEVAASRRWVFHDLYSNGKAVAHIGSRDTETGVFGGKYALGEGVKTVQLFFPWSAKTYLRLVELADGSKLIPSPRAKKMLIYGDSITQGYDATYPSRCYANVLAQKLNAEARNKGIGGEVFAPDMLSLEGEDFDPDYITVAYGTNDWCVRKDAAEWEEKAHNFYHKLSAMYPNAKIFAITPIWRAGTENPAGRPCAFTELASMIEHAVQGLDNVTVINGYNFVPHDTTCYTDGLHPNDTGFAYYAERLWAKLLPLL